MAYDRDERDRDWGGRPSSLREDRHERGRGGRDEESGGRSPEERGFFERAGDEISSWFSGEDEERERGRGYGRERDRWSSGRHDDDRGRDDGGNYRPMAGDYGRSGREDSRDERGSHGQRDPYRRTSFAGSAAHSNRDDRDYAEWRRGRAEETDRDYQEYCRERQERFERDFGGWRERRQSKRQLLGCIREHMEVVGSDGEHVGTVDRVAGERIILTRSDPEAGGVHHSLSCTDVEGIEDDRVVLELKADQARERWRDEHRERALFEREDQGEAGPHMLDRSFSGTYR